MYRVVIVDDEPWALIGMRKVLESGGNRFKVICETTDPLHALEVISKERPDVVFTDVRMPDLTGIELLQKARAEGVEADFIVISGFAEFSYVQLALQAGAMDYQLKPLDMSKAEEMTAKLYQRLENKRSAADLSFYISLLEEYKDNQSLMQTRMHRPLYQKFQVVTVYYNNVEFDDIALFDLGNKTQFTTLKLGPRKCVFIINSAEVQSALIYTCLTANESLLDRAGISLSSDGSDHLSVLLKTSDIASNDCFVNPSNKISLYNKGPKNVVRQYAKQITEALELAQYKNLKELAAGMTAFYTENGLGIEDAVFLWNEIVMHTTANGEHASRFMDLEYLDYSEMKEKFKNLEALSEYLYEQLSDLERDQPGDAGSKFKELLSYTNKHYQEELFLKELSNRFFINVSYCSELFKKTTGLTFSQYITDLRMKKACELLLYSELSISDVCKNVGYSDYFYFNKAFKRYTGYTPAKYRKDGEQ